MTRKLWWMALPALLLVGARSAGAPPTPAAGSATGTAAKSDCPACPNSQGGTNHVSETPTGTVTFGIGFSSNGGLTGRIDSCVCASVKAKIAKMLEQFPDNPAMQAAAHVMKCCASGQQCSEGAACCASGKSSPQCCASSAACCKTGTCCASEKCCGQCPCADCGKCQKAQSKYEPRMVSGQFVPPLPPAMPFAPGMPSGATPYTNFYSVVPSAPGMPPVVMPFAGMFPVPPPMMPTAPAYHVAVPVPTDRYEFFCAPAPVSPPMMPPVPSKSYMIATRLMEKTDGQENCITRPTMLLAENQRGYCRSGAPTAGDAKSPTPIVSLSLKVRAAKAGNVRLQATVQESRRFNSKQQGTMLVSDRCQIQRSVKLGEWVKLPLEPQLDDEECGCWLEVMVKEQTQAPARDAVGRIIDHMMMQRDFAAPVPPPPPPPVPPAPPAPEVLPFPREAAAPCPCPPVAVARQVVQCSTMEAVKSAAPACRIRVVTEGGCSRLEICNGGATCLSCERMSMKMASGQQIDVGVTNSQVVVRCASFCGYADVVTTSEKGQIILNGNAVLFVNRAGQNESEMAGKRIVLGLNYGRVEAPVLDK